MDSLEWQQEAQRVTGTGLLKVLQIFSARYGAHQLYVLSDDDASKQAECSKEGGRCGTSVNVTSRDIVYLWQYQGSGTPCHDAGGRRVGAEIAMHGP